MDIPHVGQMIFSPRDELSTILGLEGLFSHLCGVSIILEVLKG